MGEAPRLLRSLSLSAMAAIVAAPSPAGLVRAVLDELDARRRDGTLREDPGRLVPTLVDAMEGRR